MSPGTQVSVPDSGMDLTACDREPIHIPGSIQPVGVLLALAADGTVLQASQNSEEHLGIDVDSILGQPLSDVLSSEKLGLLLDKLSGRGTKTEPVYLETVHSKVNRNVFQAIAHRTAETILLELEPAQPNPELPSYDLYSVLGSFISRLKNARNAEDLSVLAAEEVRQITAFDRVLVYKFDAEFNGHVIAESKVADWGSYSDLWFPASDIPQQARRLYELNRLRFIADASYAPVPVLPALNPQTGRPLDMSFANLRSVSPVHLEYLRNMGVASSMSVSLLADDGRLWGLIACHHRTPLRLPFNVRNACDLIGIAVSTQLTLTEQRSEYERRIYLKSITTQLLSFMAQEENFLDGLIRHSEELLAFASAHGAAVLNEGACYRTGICPTETQIWDIVDWLVGRGREEVYETDCLPALIPGGESYRETASGVLAISISKIHRSYILWFRPEVVQTVTWGGDPRKPAEYAADRLHPRKSFEAWKETVRGRSLPWEPVDLEAVTELRNTIIGIVLRKAEELAQLSGELQRSNKELEAFSYSVSHDLRAPFRHIVGYSELLKQSPTAQLAERDLRFLDIIVQSAQFAGSLVDSLLSFSQVGRTRLKIQRVVMNQLIKEVVRDLEPDVQGRNVTWQIGDLPDVQGDLMMLRLVWQNLLHNAVKYTSSREHAIVEVSATSDEVETVFSVKDNGVGFEQQYVGKLFGVFQRLHRMEDYDGTGIGLANVRRIVSRHRGRTWAEGEVDKGATFYFSLPHKVKDGDSA